MSKKKTPAKKTLRKATTKKATSARKKPAKKAAPVKKSSAKKTPAKKKAAVKKSTAKKIATRKAPVKKKVVKKAATKKTSAKKASSKRTTPKKTAVKKTAVKKAPVKKKTTKKAATRKTSAKKASTKKTAPRQVSSKTPSTILKTNAPDKKRVFDEKKLTPIVFSLDDVNALLAERKKPSEESKTSKPKVAVKKKSTKSRIIAANEKSPTKKRVLGAASLADILGFDPAKKKNNAFDGEDIPKKWKKYYKLLLDLRNHVQEELDLHTADTLKHASGEDAGDLAHYGNHQADAGTDAFDRDFALSLVSSEQDALNEIEEAIQRMRDGSYGVCEVTGKPINNERLLAVPFARFSVEGQKEYEKNKRRKMSRDPGNIFADGDDTLKLSSDEEDED